MEPTVPSINLTRTNSTGNNAFISYPKNKTDYKAIGMCIIYNPLFLNDVFKIKGV